MPVEVNIEALIPILGGILVSMYAYRVIPLNTRNPQKAERWHRKWGKWMRVVGPILVGFGVLLLFRIL